MSDIRWAQRFENYRKALPQLTQAVGMYDESAEALIREGILHRFEFTHELAWKVMKDFLEYEGHQNITGSRSASRQAFALGLLEGDAQVWMDMIHSRSRTVHTYDAQILEDEFRKVRYRYTPAFVQFEQKMAELVADLPGNR